MVKYIDPEDFYSDENVEAMKKTAIITEESIDLYLRLNRKDLALNWKNRLFDYLDEYIIHCDKDFVREMKSRVEEKLK